MFTAVAEQDLELVRLGAEHGADRFGSTEIFTRAGVTPPRTA